jgi:hypothetical protein
MNRKLRTHVRHNLIGYLALFVSLSTGTAWAVEATITSADIVDNEIRSADIRNGLGVRGIDVIDEDLTAADLALKSVGASELDPAAFDPSEIGPSVPGEPIPSGLFGIRPDAIDASEIQDNAVLGVHISNGTVKSEDISDGGVTSADVATNSLTGVDIVESSLGEVQVATRARNVNFEVVQPIEFLAGPNTSLKTILSTVGLTIKASCSAAGDLEVYASTDRNARLHTISLDTGYGEADNVMDLESFTSASPTVDLLFEDEGDQLGHTAYMTSAGAVTLVEWAADEGTSSAFGTQCTFVGTAFSH